ncbi:hypothetical protein ACEPAI_4094 [Sanghuangporus weigelae]
MSLKAAHPLDDFSLPTGGVILKSADGVEFKVYKNILALVSPFFRDMFTLSQAGESNDGEHQGKAIAVPTADVQAIDISESSSTIDTLLRLLYPISPPSFPGISESGKVTDAQEFVDGIGSVLAAALKYDMQIAVEKLCTKLLEAVETTFPNGSVVNETLSLHVFVLACRLKLKEMARRAAYASLKGSIAGVFIEDLRQINAAQYLRLLQFHTNMADKVKALVINCRDFSSLSLVCASCGGGSSSSPRTAKWVLDFVARSQPIISQSPAGYKILTQEFIGDTIRKDLCRASVCEQVPEKWNVLSNEIRQRIDIAIANQENDIDLSEI